MADPKTPAMFATAELGASVGKDDYERRVDDLRVALINAQYDLREADFALVLVMAGDDWLAVEEALEGLGEWMDSRYIQLHAMGAPTDEEDQRPAFWRYWRRLPAHGQMAVFADAWSTDAVRRRLTGELGARDFDAALHDIATFEAALAADGTELLKFWFHLPKAEQKKRIKRARKSSRGDWRLTPEVEALYERYDEVLEVGQRLIESTDAADRPWHLVESTDRRHRSLAVGEQILAALRARLDRVQPTPVAPPAVAPPAVAASAEPSVLDRVDLGSVLGKDDYREALDEQQERLFQLTNKAAKKGVSAVLAFEGWDAAGKGGAIRRVMAGVDVRNARVIPIAAPDAIEASRHYLWRFWRHLPPAGRMLVFDRTWYGRVLVERVEGFASEAEWRRAYGEINDFEQALHQHGTVVQKFWLHIDADEQLRRFQAREQEPIKSHKITDEDYRNRERWHDYVAAVDEMVQRTSTSFAPWHLIPANDKRFARVEIVKRICEAYEQRL